MDATIKKVIEEIIAVCDESIEDSRIAEEIGYQRVPIGRADTYMIRNTLRSMLDICKNWPCESEVKE